MEGIINQWNAANKSNISANITNVADLPKSKTIKSGGKIISTSRMHQRLGGLPEMLRELLISQTVARHNSIEQGKTAVAGIRCYKGKVNSEWAKNTEQLGHPTGCMHPENQKYFQAPVMVLQLVTNRGLYSVPGRTMIGPDGPQYFYHCPSRP